MLTTVLVLTALNTALQLIAVWERERTPQHHKNNGGSNGWNARED